MGARAELELEARGVSTLVTKQKLESEILCRFKSGWATLVPSQPEVSGLGNGI